MAVDYAQIITTFYDDRFMDVEQRKAIRRECSNSLLDYAVPQPTASYVVDDHSPIPPDLRAWEVFVPATDNHRGVGASLNRGMKRAKDDGFQFALYAVDDWLAKTTVDLRPVLRLMADTPRILGVRLGLPHPDMTGRFQHTERYGWYVELDPHHIVISHRPTIWRISGIEDLGWWPEDCSALECEAKMNKRWIHRPSWFEHKMWYWLPTTFDHIESVSLSDVNPTKR